MFCAVRLKISTFITKIVNNNSSINLFAYAFVLLSVKILQLHYNNSAAKACRNISFILFVPLSNLIFLWKTIFRSIQLCFPQHSIDVKIYRAILSISYQNVSKIKANQDENYQGII